MRLKTNFHETFTLSRPAVNQVLSVLASDNIDKYSSRFEVLRAKTQLGANYVKSMPRYSFGSGLINKEDKITAFGKAVISKDPLLDLLQTQWLMHYFLCSPLGPGPVFWYELVSKRFRIGDEFSTDEIASEIGKIYQREEGKSLSDRSARSTATIFLGTYTKLDGLGNLHILKELGKYKFRVLEPLIPPMWVIAFALISFWQNRYPEMTTIHLNDLYNEAQLTKIFLIGKGSLNRFLEEMQKEGVLEVFRSAPPYQVALLNRDFEYSLGKIYGKDINF